MGKLLMAACISVGAIVIFFIALCLLPALIPIAPYIAFVFIVWLVWKVLKGA